MFNQEFSISLKIPEYCFRRRSLKGGVWLDQSVIHALTDEDWESPKITPNFGDEDNPILMSQKLSSLPKIQSLAGDNLENFDKPEALKPQLENDRRMSSIISETRIPSEEYIESTNDNYGYEYDDNDALSPLVSSAARYRLYDIDWDEKSKPKKVSKKSEIRDDTKLDDTDFCLLDSTGIKGPKVFETQQGKVIITENGDFSFEFSNKKKLFTVKGGGCFVIVSDTANKTRDVSTYPSSEATNKSIQDYSENEYHISELPMQHLKRYIYGNQLCETIKSFIPKVKLKISQEGTYFLMSNHLTFADFRAEFSSNLTDPVISVQLTNCHSIIIFTTKSGKKIEFDKLILDKMGVYEQVDRAFEEDKYSDYLINKSHEISECEIKWSTIINIWRLVLNRLVDCKNLELKGLKAYSESLISSDIGLSICESPLICEVFMMNWYTKKSVYENIFPIQVEKLN